MQLWTRTQCRSWSGTSWRHVLPGWQGRRRGEGWGQKQAQAQGQGRGRNPHLVQESRQHHRQVKPLHQGQVKAQGQREMQVQGQRRSRQVDSCQHVSSGRWLNRAGSGRKPRASSSDCQAAAAAEAEAAAAAEGQRCPAQSGHWTLQAAVLSREADKGRGRGTGMEGDRRGSMRAWMANLIDTVLTTQTLIAMPTPVLTTRAILTARVF